MFFFLHQRKRELLGCIGFKGLKMTYLDGYRALSELYSLELQLPRSRYVEHDHGWQMVFCSNLG